MTASTKLDLFIEYEVGKLFEEHGWNVINNRYYLDDVKQESREIDIIAYKGREVKSTLYYTTLIISCKKSIDDKWTFLVKDLNEKDPNINLHPINDWSNNKVLNYMKSENTFNESLTEGLQKNKNVEFSYGIKEQVFSFQQISKKSTKPQNDKDIYNSIITSIKALEYEKNTLDNRVNREAFYNFNLVSIFDGEMYSIKYSDKDPVVKEIDHIKYLNRHIVNKTESFYRVHFIKFNHLKNCIEFYNSLHDWHVELYSGLKSEYKKLIEEENSEAALMVLKDEVAKRLNIWLSNSEKEKSAYVDMLMFDKNKRLMIVCDLEETDWEKREELFKKYNENKIIQEVAPKALRDIYEYEGEFYFDSSLPF